MTSMFEGRPLKKQGLFLSKQGSFGFQVNVGNKSNTMDPKGFELQMPPWKKVF